MKGTDSSQRVEIVGGHSERPDLAIPTRVGFGHKRLDTDPLQCHGGDRTGDATSSSLGSVPTSWPTWSSW
jgi:hypothetical protein